MKTIRLTCVFMAVLLAAGQPARGQSDIRPEQPNPQTVPAAWREFPIDWKPTWDETWETNLAACTPQAVKDPALEPVAGKVAEHRRIWLLESLMARFPQDRARHVKAYVEIAEAWQRTGGQYWRSAWGVKLLRDFPNDPEAVRQGYQLALGWSFGQYVHWGTYVYYQFPECRDFAYLIPEIIEKNRAGKLPDDHPAVTTAYGYQSWLTTDLLRYDEFHPFLATLRTKGRRVPSYLLEANEFLTRFGHHPAKNDAAATKPQSKNELGTVTILDDDGTLRAVRPEYELSTRWDVLCNSGPLAPGRTDPVVPEDVQRVLDLIVRSRAQWTTVSRHAPFWNIVDRRLRELPADRIQPLRDAQELAGRNIALSVAQAGDKRKILRTFNQYPFSESVHRVMVEAAESDMYHGRFPWPIMAYEDVLAHAADPQIIGQARAGLWLVLSQSPLYRRRLEKAMAAVPDDTLMPWRGATVTAAKLKRELLADVPAAATPVARAAPITLAQLPRRRIVLPADWPARPSDACGPHMPRGFRTPWPVTRAEIAGDYTLLGCARAVARFNTGSGRAAWRCEPVDAGGPVSGSAEAAGFTMQQSPVGVKAAASRDTRFYLQETRYPLIVAAVNVRTGEVLWTTQYKTGWTGLTPLTHPAAAEGLVFLLAGPEKVERLAALGFDDSVRIVQQLICLDAADGEIVWHSPMGWVPNSSIDLARGAGAVAIHEGSVYSANSMGILARHDASDGSPEWVTSYTPARQHSNAINSIREGSTPLVFGDKVILAPRDHTGVLAFHRNNGGLIWEAILVPSDRLVGVAGTTVIGANSKWLVGLDLETGQSRWLREFPGGIASQAAIMTNGSVVVVSAGRAFRLAAATGQTLEELDLQVEPGADFVIGQDGTLVDVAPAPMAPDKGPATAGRPLQLPLQKVWSVACDAPVLALRDGADAATDAMGVLAFRRLGVLRTRPRWEMSWQRLLAEEPNAVSLAGDRLLTAQRWTLTSYDAAGGAEQWAMQLPNIPVTLGGDDKLVYARSPGDNGGSSYYAAVDPARQKVIWRYTLHWDPRFGNGPFAAAFRRLPDGSATLSSVINGPGGQVCEVVQDAATGRIRSYRPISPPGAWSWAYTYDEQGIGWVGSNDHVIRAVGVTGEESLTAAWPRKVEFKYNGWLVNVRADSVYLRLNEHLLRFNPATKAETDYDLAPGAECPDRMVLEFRRLGDRLLVVSGDIGGAVYADLFDYATARRLSHQVLPDVMCCVKTRSRNLLHGLDTQVLILDGSIVVTDLKGIHVFASARD